MQMTTPETTPAHLVYQTRFGEIKLREDRLMSFPTGLLGFQQCTTFGLSAMPNASGETPLMLLQCVNEPGIAFVVADPTVLGLEIATEEKQKAVEECGMATEEAQLLVILTLYEQEDSFFLTANLKAPLVIDSLSRIGRQYIINNPAYTTQHKV